jgi:hypothetical protein
MPGDSRSKNDVAALAFVPASTSSNRAKNVDGRAKPSQAKPSQAKPSQAKPSQAKPSYAMTNERNAAISYAHVGRRAGLISSPQSAA